MFLDGELSQTVLPEFFGHLTACASCRDLMNAMMDFRRMSRHGAIHVPPQADEAILSSLEHAKKRSNQRDRYYERRPLWQAQARMSLATCVILALAFFFSGIKVAYDVNVGRPLQPLQTQQAPEPFTTETRLGFNYVWHPGLVVESAHLPEEDQQQ